MKVLVGLVAMMSVLGFASVASGQSTNAWTGCSGSLTDAGGVVDANVGSTGTICFEFDEGWVANDTSFRVESDNASVCWVRDVNVAAGGAAVVDLYSCPTGLTPALATCGEKLQTFSTDKCVTVTRGTYYLDVTTQCDSDDDCVVAVRGY